MKRQQIERAMAAGRLAERREILAQLDALVVVSGAGREKTALAYEAIDMVRKVIERRGRR